MLQETEIWQHLSKFRSTLFSQQYLTHCYEKKQLKNAEKLSYQNCYPFIYYLEFSEKYFKQVNHSPIELHPILIFYGMVQLLKACILTQDPSYPATSQVLAHGVSTRKRKKAQYVFLEDEVKIQKNGLLTHFPNALFHMKQFPGEKFKMRQLLRQIAELQSLFSYIEKRKHHYPLTFLSPVKMSINKNILDEYKLGLNSFRSFLSARSNLKSILENENELILLYDTPVNPLTCAPFLYNLNTKFYLSPYRNELMSLPEIIIHYLVLYNLSMICRYETEWWGDLFHLNSEKDYPFIETFLSISKKKVPYLLFIFLNNQIDR